MPAAIAIFLLRLLAKLAKLLGIVEDVVEALLVFGDRLALTASPLEHLPLVEDMSEALLGLRLLLLFTASF